MPSGRFHEHSAAILSVPLGVACFAGTESLSATFVCAGGFLFGTYYLSPDLDLEASLNGKLGRRWWIFRYIWVPYTLLVPHRSWVSHSGFSVLIRVGYLLAHFLVILVVGEVLGFIDAQQVLGVLAKISIENSRLGFWLIVGLVLSDLVHITEDRLKTFLIRRTNGKRRQRQWRAE